MPVPPARPRCVAVFCTALRHLAALRQGLSMHSRAVARRRLALRAFDAGSIGRARRTCPADVPGGRARRTCWSRNPGLGIIGRDGGAGGPGRAGAALPGSVAGPDDGAGRRQGIRRDRAAAHDHDGHVRHRRSRVLARLAGHDGRSASHRADARGIRCPEPRDRPARPDPIHRRVRRRNRGKDRGPCRCI